MTLVACGRAALQQLRQHHADKQARTEVWVIDEPSCPILYLLPLPCKRCPGQSLPCPFCSNCPEVEFDQALVQSCTWLPCACHSYALPVCSLQYIVSEPCKAASKHSSTRLAARSLPALPVQGPLTRMMFGSSECVYRAAT